MQLANFADHRPSNRRNSLRRIAGMSGLVAASLLVLTVTVFAATPTDDAAAQAAPLAPITTGR
jgi:hypothetical protein